MNQDKYKIAQEVFEEYINADEGPNDYSDFLKQKTTPPDPLFEKWKELNKYFKSRPVNLESDFTKFKEIFAPHLNGSQTVDLYRIKQKFIEFLATFNVRGQPLPSLTVDNLADWITGIVRDEVKPCNGTQGLDEAIEYLQTVEYDRYSDVVRRSLVSYLVNLKSRQEKS